MRSAQRVIMGCRGDETPRETECLRQRAANPGHTRRARASAPAVCCSAHSGRAPRKKRSLQQSSLARHWPRDWRALSLARVSGRRPPRAREHMLPGHSMGSGRIHSSVKVGDEKRNPGGPVWISLFARGEEEISAVDFFSSRGWEKNSGWVQSRVGATAIPLDCVDCM